MLLTEKVTAKWSTKNKEIHEKQGYCFTGYNKYFDLKVIHLSKNSGIKVDVECDGEYCNHKLMNMTYQTYNKQVKSDGKIYCSLCNKKMFQGNAIRKTRLKNGKSFYDWCLENNRQDILEAWDYELNNPYTPQNIPSTSNGFKRKGYWFKCLKYSNHKSELTRISLFSRRPNDKLNCSQCNSFEQWCIDNNRQDVLDRWDYELNECKPNEISHADKEYYYFKCQNKKHKSEKKHIYVFTLGYEGSLYCK